VYIEHIDLLRCPEPHDESQLVAAFNRMDGRHVIDAKLGCPVCGAEFFIRNEVAIFSEGESESRAGDGRGADAIRISAFLNLVSVGKTVLLAGDLANAASSVAETSGAKVISLNSPSPTHAADDVAEIRAKSRIPLASKSLDGIALDASHSTLDLFREAARLLKPGARLYAQYSGDLPPQFHELAGGDNEMVAELVGDLVTLKPRR